MSTILTLILTPLRKWRLYVLHRCVFPFLLTIIIPRTSLLQLVNSHHDSWSMNFNLLSCHQHVGIWNSWSCYFFHWLCFGWISFCWDCVIAYFHFSYYQCLFLFTSFNYWDYSDSWDFNLVLLCTWRMGDTGRLVKSSNYRLEIVGGLMYVCPPGSKWSLQALNMVQQK